MADSKTSDLSKHFPHKDCWWMMQCTINGFEPPSFSTALDARAATPLFFHSFLSPSVVIVLHLKIFHWRMFFWRAFSISLKKYIFSSGAAVNVMNVKKVFIHFIIFICRIKSNTRVIYETSGDWSRAKDNHSKCPFFQTN